jgi:DNA-binding response OmpR family regulator
MRILMVQANPDDARLLREHLETDHRVGEVFQVVVVDRLALALQSLNRADVEAVLLDLSLPDSQGIGTLTRMHAEKPGLPIVVLSSVDDEVLGLQLLRAGAQDYLVKEEITGSLLRRSLRYAVERKRAEVELRRSEIFLESIVENIPDMIFVKDARELRFVRFN